MHWFFVARDIMWVALAVLPLFGIGLGAYIIGEEYEFFGGAVIFGAIIVQLAWVLCAFRGLQ